MENGYFTVPRSFVNDMSSLSQPTIAVLLILRSMVYKYENGECWVRCSYDYITEKANIKSSATIRKAILELAAYGWIKDFRRGGNQIKDESGELIRATNQYLLPEERIKNPSTHLYNKIAYKKE